MNIGQFRFKICICAHDMFPIKNLKLESVTETSRRIYVFKHSDGSSNVECTACTRKSRIFYTKLTTEVLEF
jgi:hypothetical protein